MLRVPETAASDRVDRGISAEPPCRRLAQRVLREESNEAAFQGEAFLRPVDPDAGEGKVEPQLKAHHLFDFGERRGHVRQPAVQAGIFRIQLRQERAAQVLTEDARVLVPSERAGSTEMLMDPVSELAVLLVSAHPDDAVEDLAASLHNLATFEEEVDAVGGEVTRGCFVIVARQGFDQSVDSIGYLLICLRHRR